MARKLPAAERIRQFRTDRGLTQAELAEAIGVSDRTIGDIEIVGLTIERDVATLLAIQHRLCMPRGSVFADGLLDPVVFLPFERENLARVAEVGRLAQAYLANASELKGYGEFLPCSLESDVFMCQHHESLFSQRYAAREPWAEIVAAYNAVGRSQRKAFHANVAPFQFSHFIFGSDFQQITDSLAAQYCLVERDERIGCLEGLAGYLGAMPPTRLHIGVIPTEQEPLLRQQFHLREYFSYDSIIVILDKLKTPVFSFYRRHSGEVGYTDRPEAVRRNAQFLTALEHAATVTGSNLLVQINAMLVTLRNSA